MFSRQSDSPDSTAVAQLESLMEAVGDAVFRLNDKGEILYLSRRAIEMIAPTHDLVGTLLADQTAIEDRLSVEVALTQISNRASRAACVCACTRKPL